MLRWGSVLFASACGLMPASASPWVRQESELYTRLAVSNHTVEGLDGVRYDSYAEYGLAGDWTVTLKYERLDFSRYSEYDRDGWRVTARRGYDLGNGLVAALEGGALSGDAIGGAAGCEALGAEARAAIGQSARIGGKAGLDVFWFAEAAVRQHEDGCTRQRLELGFGQQIQKDVWVVTQAWLDEGDRNAASRKVQLEYLWKGSQFDISAGTVVEFGGEFEESALFVSLAKTF